MFFASLIACSSHMVPFADRTGQIGNVECLVLSGDLELTALLPVWRSSLSSFAVWSFYSFAWSVPLRENATALLGVPGECRADCHLQ